MRKIRIHDTVQVMAGKARGQRGKVLAFVKDGDYVIVEGVNLVTKFIKKGMLGKGQPGQIVKKEAPIHISNVRVVCPICGEVTKIAIEIKDKNHKYRKCKKCGALIDLEKKSDDKSSDDAKKDSEDKSKI